MAHRTQYRFYIQPYPAGTTTYTKKDIETEYSCDYMKFSNLVPGGDVKNVYEEKYAEKSGVRVYIPSKDNLTFSEYECKLQLLFKGANAKEKMMQFQDDMYGTKIEWSDTFRGRYATLLLTKSANIVSECLYGANQYVVAEYTFKNIDGRTFSTTQIQ